MTDREKLDKLNVSVTATLIERMHCICDMCHGKGKVITVLIPETKYRPMGNKMFLANEPIRMWMCESCRDKLLRAISIPFQEPKSCSPMTDREKLVELINHVAEGHVVNLMQPGGAEALADHLLANGVTVQGWISVEDRLPEVEQGCSGNPKAYEFSKPVLATVAGYVMLGRFTYWHGGAFEFDGVDADFDRDQPVGVTHWMPLPEPPKEESKGLYGKHRIFRANGTPVKDRCFVLKPDKDPAAVKALQAYAAATDDEKLRQDLYEWVGHPKGGAL